jgi:cold shock CspA family protein
VSFLQVEFQVEETKRNNTRTAVNVKLVARSKDGRQQGFIAAIKENYGFIESADHQKEVFFHFRYVFISLF